MSSTTARFWTEERVEFVRAKAAEGWKMEQVAHELDTTKNAVAGIAERKGIKFPIKRRNGQPPERKPKPKGPDLPIVTALDRFAELIANGATVKAAGIKVYGYEPGGKLAMMQLEQKYGWQAA